MWSESRGEGDYIALMLVRIEALIVTEMLTNTTMNVLHPRTIKRHMVFLVETRMFPESPYADIERVRCKPV